MRRIITIGRELGRRLSEKLHIAYYDQEIITEIAERTSMSEKYVRQIMESRPIMSRQDCVQSFGVFRITVDRRDTVGIGVEILCMACK